MNEEPATAALDFTISLPPEYKLVEKLGQGGTGQVYKAFYGSLDKYVAVKILNCPQSIDQGREGKRLLNEAKALSKLDHPNIVKVLSAGMSAGGVPFLVYEFLGGETLQAYIESGKPMPEKFLSVLFEQICSALNYLHSNKMVHRDIKPANIMVLPSESRSLISIKLLDFGLAKSTASIGDDSGLTKTETTAHRGSPAYMSPEQCSGKDLDFRSDIYSLGCVLYECLLGRTPFEGGSIYEVLYQHINAEPPLGQANLSAEWKA